MLQFLHAIGRRNKCSSICITELNNAVPNSITYTDVVVRSERLLNRLLHIIITENVKHRDGALIIAIYMKRSASYVCAILAILKLNAIFIPLDPSFCPSSRLLNILKDSNCKFVLTDDLHMNRICDYVTSCSLPDTIIAMVCPKTSDITATNICTDLAYDYDGVCGRDCVLTDSYLSNLAYIIYTSGSTGRPKGVCVTCSGLENVICWFSKEMLINEKSRMLGITSFSFDISILEVLLPIVNGGELILLCDETSQKPSTILNVLIDQRISIMQATPTTYEMLLASGASYATYQRSFAEVDILVGGESFRSSLLPLFQYCKSVRNVYGPTETTIWSMCCLLTRDDYRDAGSIPLGRPISQTVLLIADASVQDRILPLVSPGGFVEDTDNREKSSSFKDLNEWIEGELCIGGIGLAEGYLNNQELTLKRFALHPKKDGSRFFRTGDYVKYNTKTGQYVYVERLDDMVKVRGYRIELGEVEAAIRTTAIAIDECMAEPSCYRNDARPNATKAIFPEMLQLRRKAVIQHTAAFVHRDTVVACVQVTFCLSSCHTLHFTSEVGPVENCGGPSSSSRHSRFLSELAQALDVSALPSYMVPKKLFCITELPITSSGKIDRNELRRMVEVGMMGHSMLLSSSKTSVVVRQVENSRDPSAAMEPAQRLVFRVMCETVLQVRGIVLPAISSSSSPSSSSSSSSPSSSSSSFSTSPRSLSMPSLYRDDDLVRAAVRHWPSLVVDSLGSVLFASALSSRLSTVLGAYAQKDILAVVSSGGDSGDGGCRGGGIAATNTGRRMVRIDPNMLLAEANLFKASQSIFRLLQMDQPHLAKNFTEHQDIFERELVADLEMDLEDTENSALMGDKALTDSATVCEEVMDGFQRVVVSNRGFLQGLRGLLAILVFYDHFHNPNTRVNEYLLGCDTYLFLILSGFTTSLQHNCFEDLVGWTGADTSRNSTREGSGEEGRLHTNRRADDPQRRPSSFPNGRSTLRFLLTRALGLLPIEWLALLLFLPRWRLNAMRSKVTYSADVHIVCAVLYATGMQSWMRPQCSNVGPNETVYCSLQLNCYIFYAAFSFLSQYAKTIFVTSVLPNQLHDRRGVLFNMSTVVGIIGFPAIFALMSETLHMKNAVTHFPYFLLGSFASSVCKSWYHMGRQSKYRIDDRSGSFFSHEKFNNSNAVYFDARNLIGDLVAAMIVVLVTFLPSGWRRICQYCKLVLIPCLFALFLIVSMTEVRSVGTVKANIEAVHPRRIGTKHHNNDIIHELDSGEKYHTGHDSDSNGHEHISLFKENKDADDVAARRKLSRAGVREMLKPLFSFIHFVIGFVQHYKLKFSRLNGEYYYQAFARAVCDNMFLHFVGFCSYPIYILQETFVNFYCQTVYESWNGGRFRWPSNYNDFNSPIYKNGKDTYFTRSAWYSKLFVFILLVVMSWTVQRFYHNYFIARCFSRHLMNYK